MVVSAAILARWLSDTSAIDTDDPKVLGNDDDSGDSLNARVTISPNGLSNVYIMITEYSSSTEGSYTITAQGVR